MSNATCTRCGRPLVGGACPLGHPQRSVRRKKRRWRLPLLVLLLVAILAAAAYAAFEWYPLREAEESMRPASQDFASALEPLQRTIDAYPEDGDAETLTEAADVLEVADDARAALTQGEVQLEMVEPPSIPVISDRTALRIARETHEDMREFHVSSLELVGDLEAVARYLTQLAPTLQNVDNLETALGDSIEPEGIEQAVAAGTPIADQLLADLRALSPPEEVGAVHASLTAIARGIRSGIEDLGELGGQAEAPVARAVLRDLRAQLESYREAAVDAPAAARAGGLDQQISAVETMAVEIVSRLRELEAEGVEGLTIPSV